MNNLLPLQTRAESGASDIATNEDPTAIGGGLFTIDIAEVSGNTPALTVIIEGEDGIPLLTSPTLSIPGKTSLKIAPDIYAIPQHAEVAVYGKLPQSYRARYDISGTEAAFRFAVDAAVI